MFIKCIVMVVILLNGNLEKCVVGKSLDTPKTFPGAEVIIPAVLPAVLPIIIGAIPRPPPIKPINHSASVSKHPSFKTGSSHSTVYKPKSSSANSLSKLFKNFSF